MLLICMCAVGLLVRARRTGGLGGGVSDARRPSPRGREGVEARPRRESYCREGGARARGAAARARDRARRATRGELARYLMLPTRYYTLKTHVFKISIINII
jgi:hypothetical protein